MHPDRPPPLEAEPLLDNLGTRGLVNRLRHHWHFESHPLYVFRVIPVEEMLNVSPLVAWIKLRRHWFVWGAVLLFVVLILQVMFQAQWGIFIRNVCAVGMFSPLLVAFGAIYFLPVVIAVVSSGVVIAERERETWDILLSTPMQWGDVVLAKLARLLKHINPFTQVLPIIYLILAMLTVTFAIVQFAAQRSNLLGEAVEWLVVAFAPLHYLIERIQDFVLACLIGLIASLLAPNRQMAASGALLAMISWLMLRGVIIAFMITLLPMVSVSNAAVILLTGFTGAFVMTLPVWLTLILLPVTVIIYDLLIRWLYRWAIQHLGEAPHFERE